MMVSGSVDRKTSVNMRSQYIADEDNEPSVSQNSKNDKNRLQEGNVLDWCKHTVVAAT